MALDNKKKAYASSIIFMIGILVALFFIEFTFAENPTTVEVSDPFPEDMEIKDVVAETNNQPSRSVAPTRNPTPKPPNPNTDASTPSEELTDNQPDESAANPFGGQNGGSPNPGPFKPGDPDGPAPGPPSKPFGDPTRLNTPKPPDYETDFGGNVCVELLINEKGKAISAKSCNSTSHPDQNVVKSVIEYIKKNVKYKAEPGAGNRKAFFSVYIQAG
jgi:hypothetical protein